MNVLLLFRLICSKCLWGKFFGILLDWCHPYRMRKIQDVCLLYMYQKQLKGTSESHSESSRPTNADPIVTRSLGVCTQTLLRNEPQWLCPKSKLPREFYIFKDLETQCFIQK